MDLLTRQQAQHHWFEADPLAKFEDLLEALGLYKDIHVASRRQPPAPHRWALEKHEKKAKLLLFTVFLRGEKQKPLQIPWFLRVRWPKTV